MKAKFLAYFLDSKIAISKLIFSVLPNNQWDLKQEYQNRKKKKSNKKSWGDSLSHGRWFWIKNQLIMQIRTIAK